MPSKSSQSSTGSGHSSFSEIYATSMQSPVSASTPAMKQDKGPRAQGLLDSAFAQQKRKLMALINKLSAIGASLDVNLPQIAVIGNQSSGKSSLIEAISGINLPRKSGTCTRVPMEVRLQQTPDKPWSCRLSLRTQNDENGIPVENIREISFGPVLTDASKVELMLQRAQLALLNPSVASKDFETYDIPDTEADLPLGSNKQLAFSRNVVCLEINGPNVTDLSLIDLPGIISNVGSGEDKSSIGLIEDMVRSYISKQCLILLTITMKDDIQNQKAFMIAREVDPDGKRTIGVLTKPDTIHGLDVEEWLPIFKNERERLLHGYHITRQPNTDELAKKISYEVARHKEADFFSSTAPWNSLDKRWKNRLGTNQLIAFLSNQLLELIKAELPNLIRDVNSIHAKVADDLNALPSAPSDDPAIEMLALINNFHADFSAAIAGLTGSENLMRGLNQVYRGFKEEIWATAPRFTPFTRAEIREDKNRALDKVDFLGAIEGIAENAATPAGMGYKVKNLDDVADFIQQSITRELPNNTPFSAKVGLIRQTIATWPQLARDTFEEALPVIDCAVDALIRKHSASYDFGMLPTRVSDIIDEKKRELRDNTLARIEWLHLLDQEPFTLNDHYITDMTTKIIAQLRDKRYPTPDTIKSNVEHHTIQAIANLANIGYPGITAKDFRKLRSTDQHQRQLEVMAEVRAYYQVAYKRIIDNLPRIIDCMYVRPMARVVRDALVHNLISPGAEVARQSLAEHPDIISRRKEYTEKRNRIGRAREELRAFRLDQSEEPLNCTRGPLA